MRKGSLSSHPLFSIGSGLLIGALYIAFESYVSPLLEGVFGASWSWLSPLLFLLFLGLVRKWALWRSIARRFWIEPMTPAVFAGISEERAQQEQTPRVRVPLPEIDAVPDEKTEKPQFAVDFAVIQARSREIEALGFELQAEGALRSDRSNMPIFVRFWRHPAGHWAEVYQMFPRGRPPLPATPAMMTYLQDGWLVGDSTQRGNWALWMLRRSRHLGKCHETNISMAAMWQSHRARCQLAQQTLGLEVEKFDFDSYLKRVLENMRILRALVWRRSAALGILQSRFFRPRNGEWWGEFPRDASEQNSTAQGGER